MTLSPETAKMDLADFMLTAKVNLALARDSRVTSLEISVGASGDTVTLRGEGESDDEARIAEDVAGCVDGVRRVHNELIVSSGEWADHADLIVQMLLQKLETEWEQLPERTAVIKCDYMRWALWLVHKFHLPEGVAGADGPASDAEAKEMAVNQLSRYLDAPSVLLAWVMQQQAQQYSEPKPSDAPIIENLPLALSPARSNN